MSTVKATDSATLISDSVVMSVFLGKAVNVGPWISDSIVKTPLKLSVETRLVHCMATGIAPYDAIAFIVLEEAHFLLASTVTVLDEPSNVRVQLGEVPVAQQNVTWNGLPNVAPFGFKSMLVIGCCAWIVFSTLNELTLFSHVNLMVRSPSAEYVWT